MSNLARNPYVLLTCCLAAAMMTGCCHWQPCAPKHKVVVGYPPFQGERPTDYRACESWANEAWQRVVADGTAGCTSDFFQRGFVQGFLSGARFSGHGGPPPLPPGRGWQAGYCDATGATGIQEWREGYTLGVSVARNDGIYSLGPVIFESNSTMDGAGGAVESKTDAVPKPDAKSGGEPEQDPATMPEPISDDDLSDWSTGAHGWYDYSSDWEMPISRLPVDQMTAESTSATAEPLPAAAPTSTTPSADNALPSAPATDSTSIAPMPPLPLGSIHNSRNDYPTTGIDARRLPPTSNPPTSDPPNDPPARKLLVIPEGYFDSPLPSKPLPPENVVPQPERSMPEPQQVAPQPQQSIPQTQQVVPLPAVPLQAAPTVDGSLHPTPLSVAPAQPAAAVTSEDGQREVAPVNYVAVAEPDETEPNNKPETRPTELETVDPKLISTVRPEVWQLFRGGSPSKK